LAHSSVMTVSAPSVQTATVSRMTQLVIFPPQV
jgi:hypothetical protein